MKLEKQTIFYFVGGLLGGYILCRWMASRSTTEFLGADGRPQTMARRKIYKWNGQGKLYTYSKRTSGVWREAYLIGGDVFSLTGNTENYQGTQYSETTITRDVNGALENIWIMTTGLTQIG
jgi:hypothetical protein